MNVIETQEIVVKVNLNEENCPHKPSSNYDNMRLRNENETYVATLNPAVIECDILNIKVSHIFNQMILDTG